MNILFFDLECVYDENHSQDLDACIEKYGEDKCQFMPEVNKILTICCGRIKEDGSYYITNLKGTEKEQIEIFFNSVEKFSHICGFNILNFNLPFIIKRALQYGIRIPDKLKFYGTKPRELNHLIDLQEIYKMNVWGGIGNLDLISKHIGLETPKDKICGSEVQKLHDEGKDDEIIEYCKKDVKACIEVYQKFLELNLV